MEAVSFENFGYLKGRLPTDLFHDIKEESLVAETPGNIGSTPLSGKGIAKLYKVQNTLHNKLENFFTHQIDLFESKFNYIRRTQITSRPHPMKLLSAWYAFQKKMEYIPAHFHGGFYSFVIWVNIPYDYREELEYHNAASCFEFFYNNILGGLDSSYLRIDKDWEGSFILFPAKLTHTVNPFYTSDNTRISLSGNLGMNI